MLPGRDGPARPVRPPSLVGVRSTSVRRPGEGPERATRSRQRCRSLGALDHYVDQGPPPRTNTNRKTATTYAQVPVGAPRVGPRGRLRGHHRDAVPTGGDPAPGSARRDPAEPLGHLSRIVRGPRGAGRRRPHPALWDLASSIAGASEGPLAAATAGTGA